MSKILALFLVLGCVGCTTVQTGFVPASDCADQWEGSDYWFENCVPDYGYDVDENIGG